MCEAFEQLSQEGKAILKRDEQMEAALAQEKHAAAAGPISSRAARRNELHHAKMAGKGGLLIDFSAIEDKKAATGISSSSGNRGNNASPKQLQAMTEKPAASWDLEDCRSWLLDASRRIAQQWVDERNKLSVEAAKKIPAGTLEELEGRLVEHSIALSEHLEVELKLRGGSDTGSSKRVITPRVNDMSKLGIKWQHSHERGSGGRGGVGGSGTRKPSEAPGRTAGQILLLKTAKKLGSMLNDPVAGDAFHKELRAVISQQEALKRKAMLEEASKRRFQQMKRKPWLQARLQD